MQGIGKPQNTLYISKRSLAKAMKYYGSYANMAKMLGIHPQYLSQIRLGRRPMPIKYIVTVKEQTGCKLC